MKMKYILVSILDPGGKEVRTKTPRCFQMALLNQQMLEYVWGLPTWLEEYHS